VGDWAEGRKHHILRQFIDATRDVRKKYLPEHGGTGGAAYIDLFAGPGRARVRETGMYVDGSPLIAMNYRRSPFTKLIFCDLDEANVDALQKRTAGDGRVIVRRGDCNVEIDRIVEGVPRYGLNLALIDPYGLDALNFDTIQKIASSSERMDLLIHYPTGDMKRNIANARSGAATKVRMGKALGSGVTASAPRHVVREIETLRANLEKLGYTGNRSRVVEVPNSKGAIMYHLVYASRNPLGDDIWQSITRPKDQRELFG
jgi:three-Cys-motif partner protein